MSKFSLMVDPKSGSGFFISADGKRHPVTCTSSKLGNVILYDCEIAKEGAAVPRKSSIYPEWPRTPVTGELRDVISSLCSALDTDQFTDQFSVSRGTYYRLKTNKLSDIP